MFHISPDQTQWFHLYRALKTSPIMFVLFCCEEVNEPENSSRFLDLRIVSSGQDTMGGSWRVSSGGDFRKMVSRADCTKFLELRAKFMIAAATVRGIDEIELTEASHDELALAISLDETLRNNIAALSPTLVSRLARDMIANLGTNQTGIQFEELSDWPTRNFVAVHELRPIQEIAPRAEPVTTKTQRVPV